MWKKGGDSPNPAGRKKGSRNRLSEQFLEDVELDWRAHGTQALIRMRMEQPVTYVQMVASLLPKEASISVDSTITHQFEELSETAQWLEETLGIAEGSEMSESGES